MLKRMRATITTKALRRFSDALSQLPFKYVQRPQRDSVFSALWQDQSFRNYVITRDRELVLAMTNRLLKPSDDEYMVLYGRRLELMDLHDEAKDAFMRLEKARGHTALAQERK